MSILVPVVLLVVVGAFAGLGVGAAMALFRRGAKP